TAIITTVDGEEDINLDLTNGRFATIGDIVKHINGVSGYVSTFVDYNQKSDLASSELDAVADLDITKTQYLMSVTGDLKLQVNRFSELVEIETTSDVTNFSPA